MKQIVSRKLIMFLALAVVSVGIGWGVSGPAYAATYTVTNTNENGAGSLNQAITDANASPGADQIDFNIPGGGLQTITYTGSMVRPTEQVTINGLSQPGSTCNGSSTELMIEINEGNVQNHFYIPPAAAGTEINGLAITNGPKDNYALLVNADDVVIRCNFFGTTDGTTPDTSQAGINRLEIYDADNVTVGGDAVTDMNVFLNNGWYAVSNTGPTARSATFKNNYMGVTLDGTTMVGTLGGGISYGGASTSVDISDNVIATTSSTFSVYFSSGSGGADNVNIANNLIGVDSTGNTAFSGTGTGLRYASAGDGLTIAGNVIAAESDTGSAVFVSDASSIDNVVVQDNHINVSQDGTSEFASTGGTNNGLLSYVPGENWLINGNVVYGEAVGMQLSSGSSLADVAVADNIFGMDSTASSCFSGMGIGITAYGAAGTDIMIGGTDPADANTICTDGSSRGIHIGSGTAGMQVAALGNSVVSASGPSLYQDPTIDISPPTITGVASNGSDTDITFTADVPAGDYRVEFFENDTNANGGGFGQLQTYVGTVNITSAGTGTEEFTETISGNGYSYLRATLTEIDGSSPDGFGMSSPTSGLGLQTDLQVVTDDGETEIFQGTTGHVITQTITNLGPTTVTTHYFGRISSCFTINTITESGTATDTGTFDDDYNPSYARWTGILNPGQNLVLTFTGDVSCSAGSGIVFARLPINHILPSVVYNGETVDDINTDNNDYIETTAIVGYKATILETTTDGLDEITVGTTDHQITQTIYSGGSDNVDTIEFDISASDCFSLSSVDESSGTYDEGTNVWTGFLQPGQTITLTFTGDITCEVGETMTFTHQTTSMTYDSVAVTDNNTEDNDFTDTTSVVAHNVDLEITTDDDAETVEAGTTDHEIVQTFSNLGPTTITFIDFYVDTLDCYSLNSVTTSGSATDTGSFIIGDFDWSGVLEQGQQLVLTYSGDISCGGGSGVNFNIYRSSMQNGDGYPVYDSNTSNEVSYEWTDITSPISDLSVTKVLNNPEDLAPGAELEYTITITNNGPDDLDTSSYDGSFGEYGFNMLFMDIMPPEITYTGWTSSDGITCVGGADEYVTVMDTDYYLGPGSASLYGPVLGNHSDHEIVLCSDTTGSEHVLANGASFSGTMTVTVTGSDLDFTNYVNASFGQSDPSQALFAGFDGSSDLIDYVQSIDGEFNNFAASAPVVDAAIEKQLNGDGSITPGETVSYDVTFTNKGPMAVDLLYSEGTPIFADLFPADALTYASVSNEDYDCQDLGPGSIAFLGNAGIDHPNHQIAICTYVGDESEVIAVGESVTLTLSFTVNEDAPSSYTNYVAVSTIPTDPDVAYLQGLFFTTEVDLLDTIDNENFAKASYTYSGGSEEADGDGDGVSDDTEDAGPNEGDANNDGTSDSQQANVSSFTNSVTGKPVALEAPDGCSFVSVGTNAESVNTTGDVTYEYPLGFIGFTLNCGTPGYTAVVTQYYYDQTDNGYVLRKYHPTNDEYLTIEGATVSEQTIAARQVVTATYQLQDGGDLDVDGATDGTIVDPAGLGMVQADSGSGLSETGYMIAGVVGLSLIIGLGAAYLMIKRKTPVYRL